MFLRQVPEAKLGKNRAHFDIAVPDEAEAVERLVGLGARVLWREDCQTQHWTVLADPQGREFCVGDFGWPISGRPRRRGATSGGS
ncbi:MAG: VOC family protein [Streptosporangiaceae bacterium]